MDLSRAPRSRPAGARRCALCHDAPSDLMHACAGCGTSIHEACRLEAAGVCPTLGCGVTTSVSSPPKVERGSADRPGARLLVAIVVGALFLAGAVAMKPGSDASPDGLLLRITAIDALVLGCLGSVAYAAGVVFAWVLDQFWPEREWLG